MPKPVVVPVMDNLTKAYMAAQIRPGRPPKPEQLNRLESVAKEWLGKERDPNLIGPKDALAFVERMRNASDRLWQAIMGPQ